MLLEEEKRVMDELFEADATMAFKYMKELIKQTKEDGDEEKYKDLSKALAEKIKEKYDEGKLVISDRMDLFMAEILGFDTSFLR